MSGTDCIPHAHGTESGRCRPKETKERRHARRRGVAVTFWPASLQKSATDFDPFGSQDYHLVPQKSISEKIWTCCGLKSANLGRKEERQGGHKTTFNLIKTLWEQFAAMESDTKCTDTQESSSEIIFRFFNVILISIQSKLGWYQKLWWGSKVKFQKLKLLFTISLPRFFSQYKNSVFESISSKVPARTNVDPIFHRNGEFRYLRHVQVSKEAQLSK